ncbi:MAG: lytic transglycosylase domain-containing protein [Opitutales bacterium]|nr:lytic transglycosylase domain-containing protein [Opitutales bacterium]
MNYTLGVANALEECLFINMPIDHHYHRDERLIIRMAAVLGVVVAVLAILLAQTFSHRPKHVSPEEVWTHVQELSTQADLDPGFIYAIVWAESSLNANARSSVARGMMQLTRPAWKEVTDESYRHAWDWRTNIRIGIGYLAFCRDFLEQRGEFSYPLLAATYRYGPYHVQDKNFTIPQLEEPENEIYRRIFNGNIRPVEPPTDPVE